jgi:TolB-like protein/DNA-binding winged helix-turn-helix (wHTH) protein/Flp pilus assembly protein TadD
LGNSWQSLEIFLGAVKPMGAKQIYEFGHFRIDAEERLLLRDGKTIPLTPKAFETLLTLVENSGHVVKKENLMKRVWPDAFVEDVNLAKNVSTLRQVMEVNGEEYIETIPKVGYRLMVKARLVSEPDVAGVRPQTTLEVPTTPEQTQPALMPRPEKQPSAADWSSGRVIAITLSTVALLGLVLFAWSLTARSPVGKSRPARIESLAVLPLENLSKDPDQEYFADGMTDALITDLAKIHELRVISRTSIVQYKGKRRLAPEIAQELKVDAIVEGTVMRSGDRVRITAQLIEARTDRHLWAETYERDLRDILALQDDVARAIAREIKITLTPPEEALLSNARAVDPAAHQAYLLGLHELHGATAEPTETLQAQALEKAVSYFQEALAHGPKDALAFAGLADAYSNLSTVHRAPLEVMPKAKAAATRAIELDDTLAEAHASLGYVALTFDWDFARAEHEFRRALELNSSSPSAHGGYSQYLLFVARRPDESMHEMQQAYALDPLLPQVHGNLAWFLFLSKRYKEAIDAAHTLGQDNDPAVALSYAELGQPEQALAAADRLAKSTKNPVALSKVAAAYAFAGRKDKARAMIPGIEGQARQRYVCGFNVACLYSAMGDKEKAFAWLETAYRNRSD